MEGGREGERGRDKGEREGARRKGMREGGRAGGTLYQQTLDQPQSGFYSYLIHRYIFKDPLTSIKRTLSDADVSQVVQMLCITSIFSFCRRVTVPIAQSSENQNYAAGQQRSYVDGKREVVTARTVHVKVKVVALVELLHQVV